MPRESTIKLLPKDILEEVNRMYRAHATAKQIVARVIEMGGKASESAVSRYKKNLKSVSTRLQRSKDISNAIIDRLGEEPEGKTARMNNRLLHSVVTDLVLQAEDGDTIKLDPGGAHFLAKSLDHLAKAEKNDAETTHKIREQAAKDAVKAVTATGKKKGLSKEAVDEINTSIMGIVKK